MPMLPAPYRMSQQGSSWGGFGRAPRQQVPGAPQGMGAYAGAGNMPPPRAPDGSAASPWTSMTPGSPGGPPMMGAQQRPQMMASALMAPQQQQAMQSQFALPQGAAPAPAGGYAQMDTVPAPNPGAGLLGNVAPNMAQAAAQQGQAVPAHQMARPMPPPTGYAR